MPRQMVTYADFRGGLNLDAANDIMADNELSIADNVDLSERGALTKRAGMSKFNAALYTVNDVEQEIEQVIPWDGQLFAIHCDKGSDYDIPRTFSLMTSTTLTAITSGEAIKALVAGRKLLVLNNGMSDIGVFAGVPAAIFKEVVRTSAPYAAPTYMAYDLLAHATKPTVSKSGTGLFEKGLYAYIVRFVNELGYESAFNNSTTAANSDYGTVTVDASQTAAQFELSNIAVGPTGTVARRIYRSDALPNLSSYLRGGFPMYLVTTLNDNTTTTYVDTLSASILVLQPELKEDDNIIRGKAGAAVQIEWHPPSGRFFATGIRGMESAIVYSEPMRIDYWKSTSVMYGMGKEAYSPGLLAFGDALFAFYSDSVYAWRGYDATNATWEHIPIQATGIRSPILTPDSVTFAADNGLYVIPTAGFKGNVTILPGADKVPNVAEGKVRTFMQALKQNNATLSPLYDTNEGRYMLRYSYGTSPVTSGVLVFDWGLQAFTHYKGAGFECASWCRGRDGTIYLAKGAQVVKIDAGATSDNGTAIPVTVRTKGYDLGVPSWKWVQKVLASFGSHPTQSTTISMGIDTGYDSATIPSLTWEAGGSLKQKVVPIHKKGQRFSLQFDHSSAAEPFSLYSLAFVMEPMMPRGLS